MLQKRGDEWHKLHLRRSVVVRVLVRWFVCMRFSHSRSWSRRHNPWTLNSLLKLSHDQRSRDCWNHKKGKQLRFVPNSRLFNAKFSFYIYIKFIWFGLVLWHINLCRLFNAKSSTYIYIEYIRFGLVEFYDISTLLAI